MSEPLDRDTPEQVAFNEGQNFAEALSVTKIATLQAENKTMGEMLRSVHGRLLLVGDFTTDDRQIMAHSISGMMSALTQKGGE